MSIHLSYQAVDTALVDLNSLMSGAEVHGTLAGMLCADTPIDCQVWLAEVLDEANDINDLADVNRRVLMALFDETYRVLDEEDFAFDLLLPDDDVPLSERSRALSQWCRGFLFGLGYGGANLVWPEVCQETLQDFVKISRLDSDAEGEADEVAYMELSEYVRVGTQLVRSELRQIGDE